MQEHTDSLAAYWFWGAFKTRVGQYSTVSQHSPECKSVKSSTCVYLSNASFFKKKKNTQKLVIFVCHIRALEALFSFDFD